MKRLIIKSDDNEFEKFYCDNIKKCDSDVITPNEIRINDSNTNMIFKVIDLIKGVLVNTKNIDYKQYDMIVIFEDEKLIPIIYRHKRKDAKLILWNWNVVTEKKAKKQNYFKSMCEIWTFDKKDAKKYGWKWNEQFYFYPDSYCVNRNEKIHAFCACLDKGRYSIMRNIRKDLINKNVTCDFYCIKDKDILYEDKDAWLVDSPINYSDFLEKVKKCDIVVDIVKKGQSGLTVRVLEGVFYDKKILTNNKEIKNYPFYNSNIYIYGEHNKLTFEEFIYNNNCKYKLEIKKLYSYDEWIKRFETIVEV